MPFNLELNRSSAVQAMRSLRVHLRRIPEWLLLEHYRAVGTTVIVAGAIISLLMVAWITLFDPAPSSEATIAAREITLPTTAIDQLEYWIEDVHAEYKREYQLPRATIFVTPAPEAL